MFYLSENWSLQKEDCPKSVGKDDYVHSAVDSYVDEYGYESFVALVMSSLESEMS